jgi:DNA invertase Pin-like site-specific DNA recombinase
MSGTRHRTVGYLRVSTSEQDLEKNKADILTLANQKDLGQIHFIEERVSGTVPWRKRKIAEVIAELHREDNIIVSELSRLHRDGEWHQYFCGQRQLATRSQYPKQDPRYGLFYGV